MREMKDSGVEWIEEIPDNWEITRLKSLFDFGKGLPITKANLIEKGIPVISYGQIHNKKNNGIHIQDFMLRYVTEDYLESNPNSLVHKGDFIFADTSEDIEGCGNCIYVDRDEKLFAGYHTIIFKAQDNCDYRFLGYLFQTDAWRWQIRSKLTEVKLYSVSRRVLSNTTVLLPNNKETQIRIADYLDAKCSKIDDIISCQKEIIEKLKEYKLAVITEAVTKGLNPNVELKESNIEWLGEIPSKWQKIKLKYATNMMRGRFNHRPRNDPRFYDGKYPFVQTGEVARTIKYITTYSQTLNEQGYAVSKEFPKGSICMTIAANVGDVAILDFDACFPDSVVGFDPTEDTNGNFLFYVMKAMKQQLMRNAIISTQLNLNIEIIKEEFIALPPYSEQLEIGSYLDKKCSYIEKTIAHRKEAIENLKEYKKSLIYEVVTGKKEV